MTPARLFAALLCVSTSGWAQSVTPPARSPAVVASNDSVTTLSPFTVSTDKDVGFVATSSLAGGRLAGDLADTPAAYSVITREFIDALNLTDLNGAIEWTVNTNVNNDNGANLTFASNVTYTTRGVGASTPQRNFFPFYVNFDSYNLERYDFGRGPNAILFGNGGLGGVSTVTTTQARFGNNFTEIAQTFGSWNNSRTTLDINRSLNDRLAVRTAAVYTDTDGWRDKQFEKVRAAFLTASFKLALHTTLRAEGEYGESKRNQTFTNLTDQLSGWNGKTVFSGRADDLNNLTNAQKTRYRVVDGAPSWSNFQIANNLGATYTAGVTGSPGARPSRWRMPATAASRYCSGLSLSSLCVPMRMSMRPSAAASIAAFCSLAVLKRDSTSMRMGQSAKRSRKFS